MNNILNNIYNEKYNISQLKEFMSIKEIDESKIISSLCPEKYINKEKFVIWNITNACNYKCGYCSITKTEEYLSLNTCKKILKKLNTFDYKFYSFELKGGEPTLHSNLLEIISCIKTIIPDSPIYITSNGSGDISLYKSLLHMGVDIRISLHSEYVDTNNILKLTELDASHKQLTILNMFNPSNFSIVIKNHEELKSVDNIGYTIDTLISNKKCYSYNEEHVSWFYDNISYMKPPKDDSILKFNLESNIVELKVEETPVYITRDIYRNYFNYYCFPSTFIEIDCNGSFKVKPCSEKCFSLSLLNIEDGCFKPSLLKCNNKKCFLHNSRYSLKCVNKDTIVNYIDKLKLTYLDFTGVSSL